MKMGKNDHSSHPEEDGHHVAIDVTSPVVPSSSAAERKPLCRTERIRNIPSLIRGMEISAHSIHPDGTLKSCEAENALARVLAPAAATAYDGDSIPAPRQDEQYWIDIDADSCDSGEVREWLGNLSLSPFLMSRLAEPIEKWTPQFLALSKASLVVIRILPEDKESQDIRHVAAVSVKGLLVTFTSTPRAKGDADADEDASAKTKRTNLSASTMRAMQAREFKSSSSALLCWLTFHADRTASYMREIRSRIQELDGIRDSDDDVPDLNEILDLKDGVLRVLSVAEEQTECFQSLSEAAADTDSVDLSNLRGMTGALLATAGSTERMALRLEKQVTDLRQEYDARQQGQINRRLKLLTVLSAIFLPLTLMAGVWGMNFENMPELHLHYFYYVALGLMGTVAAIMMCFFYRNGWFS